MKKQDNHDFNTKGFLRALIVLTFTIGAFIIFVAGANYILDSKRALVKQEVTISPQELERRQQEEFAKLSNMTVDTATATSVKYAGTNKEWDAFCKKIDSDYVGAFFNEVWEDTRFGACARDISLIAGREYSFTVENYNGTAIINSEMEITPLNFDENS